MPRPPRAAAPLLAAAAALGAVPLVAAPAARATTTTPEWIRQPVAYTTTPVEFEVVVGPPGAQLTCNVDADLRVPVTATATHPAPAILTSNGFGGSKSSTGATAANASYAEQYAAQGYVTLSYSGLGFGGSSCPIQLDAPAYDGEAARALVSFLGGDTSQAHGSYTPDPTGATPGTWSGAPPAAPPVLLDRCDHAATPACGAADPHDPRVGMIGGSYGGENQLAAAAVDPRIDTIIPQITWNDLAYSLAPNNQGAPGDGGGTAPVTQSAAAPGVEKFEWTTLFFALGAAQPIVNPPAGGASGCVNFTPAACAAKAQMDAVGYPTASTVDFAHTASAGQYLADIRVPVFLSQGQDDTLFTLREATTTFEALRARNGAGSVKMLWQQWGHSGGPAVGEADATTPVPELTDDLRYSAWFARYLRGDRQATTGPAFEYLAPWLPDDGSTTTPDTGQYLGAPSYPVGRTQSLYLSGSGSLVTTAAAATAGSATFTATPATTTSYTETSAVDQSQPVTDAPGTFAAFSTPPLAADADQVGSPTLTVSLSAPTFAQSQDPGGTGAQPGGELVLFAKLYDVSPSGTITLANRLISPVRVTDVTRPVTIHLPAIVHRYPAGDHLELVLAAGDSAYKGNDTSGPVTVLAGPATPGVLRIPLVDASSIQVAAGRSPGAPGA